MADKIHCCVELMLLTRLPNTTIYLVKQAFTHFFSISVRSFSLKSFTH